MSVISKAFNKYKAKSAYQGQYVKLNYCRVCVPVGRKELPKSICDSKLSNDISTLFIPLPLINDLSTEEKTVTKVLHSYLGSSGFYHATITFMAFVMEYLAAFK